MSPVQYFPISQSQGGDHQQWFAATDLLGPVAGIFACSLEQFLESTG